MTAPEEATRRARRRAARSLRHDAEKGFVALTVGKEETHYWLTPLSHDDAGTVALRFSKFVADQRPGEPDGYDVTFTPATGARSCECLGFLRWSRCKHADAAATLFALGRVGGAA